jgi:hypothetical protein
VQSSFVENQQGEISGLSRSVSNLGSSLGVRDRRNRPRPRHRTPARIYALAMAVLAAFGVIGFNAAMMLPRTNTPATNLNPCHQGDTPADAATGNRLDHPTEGRSALRARTHSH